MLPAPGGTVTPRTVTPSSRPRRCWRPCRGSIGESSRRCQACVGVDRRGGARPARRPRRCMRLLEGCLLATLTLCPSRLPRSCERCLALLVRIRVHIRQELCKGGRMAGTEDDRTTCKVEAMALSARTHLASTCLYSPRASPPCAWLRSAPSHRASPTPHPPPFCAA